MTAPLVFSTWFCFAIAQVAPLKQPDPSPAARVSQTVGITEMTIDYHRPAVNKREIFGGLVPWNEVWRAGANQNTTITFSTPVKVATKPLPAGTYGLHMIPTPKSWTIIFSKTAGAWGSFTYDAKEDALRITATPRTAEHQERLGYTFDDPSDTKTTISLRWDKVQVSFPVEVDTPALVMASMKSELRGLGRFYAQPWAQAARYWVDHGGDLDEAADMAKRSVDRGESFTNLRVSADIQDKKGDAKKAAELRERAFQVATEQDLNLFGYGLIAEKKIDQAIAIFKRNSEAHPTSWNVWDSLGEAQAAKGDKSSAIDSYGRALSMVKDDVNKKRIETVLARLRGHQS